MKQETKFYTFEIEESEGSFVRVRKILNGKCTYEGGYRWLSTEEQKALRKRLIHESYYMNYNKAGMPKVSNLNGFEILRENGKLIIKYFNSGMKSAESSYDLKLINDKKEKIIIKKLSNLCLNNMEAENTGYSLIFMIQEAERVIFS